MGSGFLGYMYKYCLFSDDIYPTGLNKISESLAVDRGMYGTTADFLWHAIRIESQSQNEDGSINYPKLARRRDHSITLYLDCYVRSITSALNRSDSENRIAAIKYRHVYGR